MRGRKRHARDGDGVSNRVSLDADFKVLASLEGSVVCDSQEPDLVQGIAAIADELTQEDFTVAVQAVDNEIHQPVHLQCTGTH